MAGRRTGGLGKGLDALIPNKAGGPSKEPAKKTRSAVVKKDKPTEKDSPAAERLVKISSVEPKDVYKRQVLHRLSIRLPKDNRDIEYAYAFCLNGCVGMIKTWLSSENQESTQHMAELTHKLIDNTTHMYLEQALR